MIPSTQRVQVALASLVVLAAMFAPSRVGATVAPGPIENLTAMGDAISGNRISVSADGQRIAFTSAASNLTTDPDNGFSDVFVYDVATATMINITADANGSTNNAVAISGDGTTVVFGSLATNLTTETDVTTDLDVFAYDVASATITRVTPDDVGGSSGSEIDISHDGATIVFTSSANLDGTATGFGKAFMWKDGAFTKLTEGISANANFISMSGDGSTILLGVFQSGEQQLHLWDVATSERTHLGAGNWGSLSYDGMTAALAVPSGNGDTSVRLMDRSGPDGIVYTTLITSGVEGHVMSGDGENLIVRRVADGNPSEHFLEYYDIASGLTTKLTDPGEIWDFAVSSDTTRIVFRSPAATFTSDPDNGQIDVFSMSIDPGIPTTCGGKIAVIEQGDVGCSSAGPEVMHAVSCLAGNGRVDTNIVNTGSDAASYRIEFQGLSARATDVDSGDWWRMPITGRPDGQYNVVVRRDGVEVSAATVTIACDGVAPVVDADEVRVVNSCRDGNGYVLFQFVNNTATTAGYVIIFDGVPNRSTSATGFGQAVRAVTGRPDGTYTATILRNGVDISFQQITIAC